MATKDSTIFLGSAGKGRAAKPQHLHLRYANRHGLIAGATGTGKTVTLRVLAEGLSAAGVPVFMADIKGDLSGIARAGEAAGKIAERAKSVGLKDYAPQGFPTVFWDVFGEHGHPVRATVSEMGPLLLARLLELSDAQEGVLTIVFKVADDHGLLLLDLKDLRVLLAFAGERADELAARYGNVAKASVGAIQRRLLALESQGGDKFFGEPALELGDLMRNDDKGRGQINVLVADRLIQSPKVYATFLLWLLAELFEELPEVGDVETPKLVFFFDEAHLLFDDAPKALVDKVEQVVRLIRSKGVGVYFVTQNPLDLPATVLGQLGNRVQHALRAFTPLDQKAVRAAAETFPKSPGLDTARAITQLAVGEALVSTLEGQGTPSATARALIRPPASRLAPLTPAERQDLIDRSPLFGKYEDAVDRESAYEKLTGRAGAAASGDAAPSGRPSGGILDGILGGGRGGRGRARESIGEAMIKSAARAIGSQIGRQIVRGVLGAILRGR
jgi:DNA helicase HerA-like ATPase